MPSDNLWWRTNVMTLLWKIFPIISSEQFTHMRHMNSCSKSGDYSPTLLQQRRRLFPRLTFYDPGTRDQPFVWKLLNVMIHVTLCWPDAPRQLNGSRWISVLSELLWGYPITCRVMTFCYWSPSSQVRALINFIIAWAENQGVRT